VEGEGEGEGEDPGGIVDVNGSGILLELATTN